LTIVGFILGLALLVFCTGILAMGEFALHMPLPTLQTLAFVTLVFGSQAMIYAIRGRPYLWSPPTEPLAGRIIDRRYRECLGHGDHRHRHGADLSGHSIADTDGVRPIRRPARLDTVSGVQPVGD